MPRLNTSQLESSLKALANDLARNLVDAVLRGSLADLIALPTPAPRAERSAARAPAASSGSSRGQGRPRSSGAASAPKARVAAPRAARASASLEGASRGQVLEALVSYLRARPDGARAEELRSELGLTRARFIQATRDGLSTEEIRKVGHLRSTVYYAL